MEHLDERSLAALLENPAANSALQAHLKTGCETCEAFLAQREVDGLEGHVDALLLRAGPQAESPVLDEVGWQRLKRSLAVAPPRRSRAPLYAGLGLALAAGLAAVVALAPKTTSGPDEVGVKGPGQAQQLELSAAVRQGDGTITRIDDGASVSQSGTLVFRYHASGPGPASVWIQRGSHPAEKLGMVDLSAGTHELSARGTLLGVSLEGESGRVTVLVVAGGSESQAAEPTRALGRVDSTNASAVGRISVNVVP